MLCRVAEDVLWMSRYVERALAVGRLIEVSQHLELVEGDDAIARASRWAPLLSPPNAGSAAADAVADAIADAADEGEAGRTVRHWLAFDRSNPRSIASCVERARSSARQVREHISADMWEALNSLHLLLCDASLPVQVEQDPHGFYQRIRGSAQFVQGLADATLAHDECWHFVCLGKYLERADNVAHVLALQSDLLRDDGLLESDVVRWLAVLRSCGASEGYARFYALRVEPARVVEFLLLNAQFPQTVRFSLRHAASALHALGGGDVVDLTYGEGTPATRALGRLSARLEFATVDEIIEGGLQPYLASVQHDVARVADHVTRTYLRDDPHATHTQGAARAARLMAEQQQQTRGDA